jgi:hypothetical protein
MTLSSGRSVQVQTVNGNEELVILSPSGQSEVCITLTPEGPAVTLHCASLRLQSVDSIAIDCRRFDVRADNVQIEGGAMRVRTTGNIDLDGENIYLNCEGYENECRQPGGQPGSPSARGSASGESGDPA